MSANVKGVHMNRNQRRQHIRDLQAIVLNKDTEDKTTVNDMLQYPDAGYPIETRIAALTELRRVGTNDDFVMTCKIQLRIHPDEQEMNKEVLTIQSEAYLDGLEAGDDE